MFIAIKFKKIIAATLLTLFGFFPVQVFEEEQEEAWFPFYITWNYCEGSKIDLSFLLDAPAGKHGFLKVRDGHFYFEDGTRARFWGVNIHSNMACFPTRSQAEDISKRLAQLGCNIVRMHFLDNEAPGGLIDGNYNDSQHMSESQWDRLDYFIYQLKQNGIYICFDVLGLGVRRFKQEDNVVDFDKISSGAGGISLFDRRIIELSKRFAVDFLSHVNPYTGNSYLDEPAIAMVEMTNENTLFADWIIARFTPYYRQEIGEIWRAWLKDKGRNPEDMEGDCFRDREFLFELEDRHHREMYSYLRSIGVKVPIGSSNTPHDNLDLATDSNMDFTDIHPYWDLVYRSERIHNRPLIKQSHLNPYTLVNHMSRAKVYNKPLVLTEWGSVWPNEWRAVDMLTTASYAALNDLDALFLYSYNGGWGMSWEALEKKMYYDTVVFNDPAKMGIFPLGALIFLRGDVRPSVNTYSVSYDLNKLFSMTDPRLDRTRLAGIMYVSKLGKIFYSIGKYKILSYTAGGARGGAGTPSRGNSETMQRIGALCSAIGAKPLWTSSEERSDEVTCKSDSDALESHEISYPYLPGLIENKYIVISDTGEIARDAKKGIFMLKTPWTFSFSGFIGKEDMPESNGIRFFTDSDFATFTVTTLDTKEISASRHLLLAVVGRVKNKNQKLAPHITKKIDDLNRDVYIIDKGTVPILVEGIEGEVFLKKKRKDENIEVFTLDERGLRKSKISVDIDNSRYFFKIEGAKHNAIYYEIVRE